MLCKMPGFSGILSNVHLGTRLNFSTCQFTAANDVLPSRSQCIFELIRCKVGCVLDLILSRNWCIPKTKINQTRVGYYSVHIETEAISMQTAEKDVICFLLF